MDNDIQYYYTINNKYLILDQDETEFIIKIYFYFLVKVIAYAKIYSLEHIKNTIIGVTSNAYIVSQNLENSVRTYKDNCITTYRNINSSSKLDILVYGNYGNFYSDRKLRIGNNEKFDISKEENIRPLLEKIFIYKNFLIVKTKYSLWRTDRIFTDTTYKLQEGDNVIALNKDLEYENASIWNENGIEFIGERNRDLFYFLENPRTNVDNNGKFINISFLHFNKSKSPVQDLLKYIKSL